MGNCNCFRPVPIPPRPEPVPGPRPEPVPGPVEVFSEDVVKTVKLVIVGASTVGKTCLINNYNTNAFSDEHIPNVLDVFRGPLELDGK